MFAVIETGGKQYSVSEGDTLSVEKIEKAKEESKVKFDKILLINDGKKNIVGKPYVKGREVEAEVVEHFRDKKVKVLRFRAKSRHKKVKGHRQPLTKVKISKIK